MQFVVVSGRSGSGKSSALHLLEDEGFICIDNLPLSLIPALLRQFASFSSDTHTKLAVGIDARNIDGELDNVAELIKNNTPENFSTIVLYLDTSREILLKRFSETRRRHPLSDSKTDLNQAIAKEKNKLAPIAAIADFTVDTSKLSLHELRSTIKRLILGDTSLGLDLVLKSFGFKFGTPQDVDFIFDLRCLSNPYWDAELRSLTGEDEKVIAFLDAQQDVQNMYLDIETFLLNWIPAFENNNRSYLTIGIGCTGGKHRSVYMAEKLANKLSETFTKVQTRHRQFESLPGS